MGKNSLGLKRGSNVAGAVAPANRLRNMWASEDAELSYVAVPALIRVFHRRTPSHAIQHWVRDDVSNRRLDLSSRSEERHPRNLPKVVSGGNTPHAMERLRARSFTGSGSEKEDAVSGYTRRPRLPPGRRVPSWGTGVTSSILPILNPERASIRIAA